MSLLQGNTSTAPTTAAQAPTPGPSNATADAKTSPYPVPDDAKTPVPAPPRPAVGPGTSDVSTLKHLGILLKPDASNMESYLYKMEKILNHKGLMDAVTIYFDSHDEDEVPVRANPFEDRHMLPELCNLTQEQVDSYVEAKGINPLHIELNKRRNNLGVI